MKPILNKIKFSNGKYVEYSNIEHAGIKRIIEDFILKYEPLPDGLIIKPNLNNDMCALTGNSVDLRVLSHLLATLKERGLRDITIAEGFNVGMDRRQIDGVKRLKIDRLAKYFGVRVLDLNKSTPFKIDLVSSFGNIAKEIADAPFLINICKIKTHAEVVMSSALKNWVGINIGQYKRLMHDNLPANIVRINEIIRPDLIIVDGLVGMEENGPGDGNPVRMDLLLAGNDSFLMDLFIARHIGFDWNEIPYLDIAYKKEYINDEDVSLVKDNVTPVRPFVKAPSRSSLAVLSETPKLMWLKRLIRPLVTEGFLLKLAYRLKIVQDVYSLEDDDIQSITISENDASILGEKLMRICPMNWEKIITTAGKNGNRLNLLKSAECIGCLYCYWILPNDVIQIKDRLGFLERHIDKYKKRVEKLFE